MLEVKDFAFAFFALTLRPLQLRRFSTAKDAKIPQRAQRIIKVFTLDSHSFKKAAKNAR